MFLCLPLEQKSLGECVLERWSIHTRALITQLSEVNSAAKSPSWNEILSQIFKRLFCFNSIPIEFNNKPPSLWGRHFRSTPFHFFLHTFQKHVQVLPPSTLKRFCLQELHLNIGGNFSLKDRRDAPKPFLFCLVCKYTHPEDKRFITN